MIKHHKETKVDRLRSTVKWTGLTGIFGSIIFLTGDFILYFAATGERNVITIMSQVPLWRLYLSGALGIVASQFYTLGTWQIYQAVFPSNRRLGLITFFALAALTIGMGTFHAVHASLGLMGRASIIAQADAFEKQHMLELTWGYVSAVIQATTVPVIVFCLLYTYLILSGQTRYPRWFALINPCFLLFSYTTIDRLANQTLPSIPYLIVSAGYINAGMMIFFASSTLVLLSRTKRASGE